MLTIGHHQGCKVGKRIQLPCYPSTTRNTPPLYSESVLAPKICGQLVLGGGREWDICTDICAELQDKRAGLW